jgi:hypothetical protein
MSRGASRPDAPPSKADQPRTRCTVSGTAADQSAGAVARASAAEVQKRAAWCMIRVSFAGQMRRRYSQMADQYAILAEAEEPGTLAYDD